jgi:hypothetical protein
MIQNARLGTLTQGTIFSCAYAERYQNCSVWGVVITARCDIAHAKAPVYSYLPIVSLEDWFVRDGKDIFVSRIKKEIEGNIKNKLTACDLSESLLKVYNPRLIYEVNIKKLESDTRKKKLVNDFSVLVENFEKINSILNRTPTLEEMRDLGSKYPKLLEGIIKELLSFNLAGYYYIQNIELKPTSLEYVVLLREVHHISSDTALLIGNGIDIDTYKSDFKDLFKRNICPKFCLEDDFAMPISHLQSPWIEHLMQSFSNLFIRIGLPDFEKGAVSDISRKLKKKEK